MKVLSLIFLFFFQTFCYAQKVGLVLSGGAAKGFAHVGVLKALEENEIPIDYIVGTSIGGIIGGCYAAGMSPYQIEQMVTSDQFIRVINPECADTDRLARRLLGAVQSISIQRLFDPDSWSSEQVSDALASEIDLLVHKNLG